MRKSRRALSEAAIFLAGVLAASLITGRRRDRTPVGFPEPASSPVPADSAPLHDLHRAISELEGRLAAQETATAHRLDQIESRLEEQAARLADTPSTQQIVAAMEQLLGRTMASLDERLTTQAHSIEVLKTTVSQTDSLLERVLESIDSLQSYAEPLEIAEDSLLRRPAV